MAGWYESCGRPACWWKPLSEFMVSAGRPMGAARTTSLAADGVAPQADVCRASFPAHYEVTPHHGANGGAGNLRFLVADPQSDRQWVLGAAELRTAELFCRGRPYGEVRDALQRRHRIAVSAEALRGFEDRLIRARLLADGVAVGTRDDPFTGVDIGWLHRLLFIPLVRIDPGRLLDRYFALAPRGAGAALAVLGSMLALLGAFVAVSSWPRLATDIQHCVVGTGWLIVYAVTLSSGVVHEGAHAIACRHYGVRVREAGLAIYLLLPFGWTRPEQAAWSRLPLSRRVVTVLVGPLGSLAFGAAGVLMWSAAAPQSAMGQLGIHVFLAGCYGATFTLLPMFNGDGYLIISELLGIPNLRRRSFEHLKQRLAMGTARPFPGDRERGALYVLVAVGTITGWICFAVAEAALVVAIIGQIVSR
jgi:putative peptide zinc metalloprotease protein